MAGTTTFGAWRPPREMADNFSSRMLAVFAFGTSYATPLAVVLASMLLCPALGYAAMPTPYIYLSFDDGFSIDGTGRSRLTEGVQSDCPGLVKIPAGKFIKGIAGNAFIPSEDIVIHGEAVFPAPEGTVSLWIKPVNYEADWINGPKLTPGRIGRFLTTNVTEQDAVGTSYRTHCVLQVRLNTYDYLGGLNWAEIASDPETGKQLIQTFSEMGPRPRFQAIWQKNKWRLITVVWSKGERRIYFDGIRLQHGTEVERNPTVAGDTLTVPAGSKAIDSLMVWDVPLTDEQVASLFFSQFRRSGLGEAVQSVPRLPSMPQLGRGDDQVVWAKAAHVEDWIDSFSGMAAEARDTLDIGYAGGDLYLRYREPMPRNYLQVKTDLGGAMLKRSIEQRDGNVDLDDSVQVRLTPDQGKSNYVFSVSASGARYDALNGDASFNAKNWHVIQTADENFWTVEMRLPLEALSRDESPATWGFNFVRTVHQQGFTRRQWSYHPGDPAGYGKLMLQNNDRQPVQAHMKWDSANGKLLLGVTGQADDAVTVSYSITPLGFLKLFPEEAKVEGHTATDMVRQTRQEDDMPEPVVKTQSLQPGVLNWHGQVDYADTDLATASVVAESEGKVLARRTFLISGSEAVSTRVYNYPSKGQLGVQVLLSSGSIAGPTVRAKVEVLPKEANEPIRHATIQGFDSISEQILLDVTDVASGWYVVKTSVFQAEKLIGRTTKRWFKSGTPVWLGNKIGLDDSVPKPWTPIKQADDELDVWGRGYSFRHSLLPASLSVLDAQILSGPMRLIVVTNKGTIDTAKVSTPSIKVTDSGTKATIAGQGETDDLRVDMVGTLDFDGFAYLHFTLTPLDAKHPVAIERVIFEVPFRKDYARLYDDSDYNAFRTQSGAIPNRKWELAGTGTIRVGDAHRGVQFWPLFDQIGNRQSDTPLSFTPNGDSVVMRYVVSEGATLRKPLTRSVGIIGTPVKPHDDARIRKTGFGWPEAGPPEQLREDGYRVAQIWTAGWSSHNGGSSKWPEDVYYNFAPKWRQGFAEDLDKKWEKTGVYKTLYLSPTRIIAETPEYAYFWKEWGGGYFDEAMQYMHDLSQYPGAKTRPDGSRVSADFWAHRSFQDFYFYSLDKLLHSCAQAGAPVGVYVDTTHRQSGDPRPYRQWMQRLYQVVRKYSPNALIAVHMSGDRRMAIWSMADVLVEGEQYTAAWRTHMANHPELNFNDAYPTLLPLDRVRASYAGTLWGPQPMFLMQLWTDKRQGEDVYWKKHDRRPLSNIRRYRYVTGLMLLNGTPLWGEFNGSGVKEDPWVKRAMWGYDEKARFIPYWDDGGLFSVNGAGGDGVVVSGWIRPSGDLIAVVLNNTEKPASIQLQVNPERAPVALKKFVRAIDITSPVTALESAAEKPSQYMYRDGSMDIDLRPRDYRLLVFEK